MKNIQVNLLLERMTCMGKKLFKAFLCIFLISTFLGLQVSAASSDTFAHNDLQGGTEASYFTREMYSPVTAITAEDIGLNSELDGMTDICVDKNENVYILCGDNSRLVVLNSDYTLKKELQIVTSSGEAIDYTGAQGIFVDNDSNIHIADTANGRTMKCSSEGVLISYTEKPNSPLIPEDFIYQPAKILIDNRGYTYVLSFGCYYGALTYSPKGEFIGFFGSNTVKAGALDTISYLWDRLTGTDEKRALTSKTLPYSFIDFCIDSDGYMLTCSIDEKKEENGKGQIRKITFNGANILYKKTLDGNIVTSDEVNFLENKAFVYQQRNKGQRFCAIDVDEYGFIYALDETYGLIYVCDSDCNVINVFGGGYTTGNKLGVYSKPKNLTVKGNSLLVADSGKFSITVYDITEYGSLFREAQGLTLKGKYEEASPIWNQVIKFDRSNQLAYRGLAMAAYYEKDYEKAVELAKSGMSYTVYDLVRQEIISASLSRNFIWIFPLVIAIIIGIVVLIFKIKKKKLVLIKNKKLKLPFRTAIHPFDSFNEIKQYNQGSFTAAIVITVLLYIAFTFKATLSGFLFKTTTPANYNMLYTLLQTVGLLLLWSIANWLVCSLFSGKGTFKEVFISTTYSLVPLVIYTFVSTLLSNFLSSTAMSVVDGIQIVVWIYTFFLLAIAMMTVHEFDFFKFILTTLVVFFFMIVIVFIGFMFIMLLSEVAGFAVDIYEEVVFR